MKIEITNDGLTPNNPLRTTQQENLSGANSTTEHQLSVMSVRFEAVRKELLDILALMDPEEKDLFPAGGDTLHLVLSIRLGVLYLLFSQARFEDEEKFSQKTLEGWKKITKSAELGSNCVQAKAHMLAITNERLRIENELLTEELRRDRRKR